MSEKEFILKNEDIEDGGDVDEEVEFSYDGYQVVRREFYAHTYDAAVNFKYDSITFNTACVSKFDTDYIHILINPTDKKMAIKMCDSDAKDAVKWSRFNKRQEKKVPRKILCRLFCAKLFSLLGWIPDYKYKLQGNLVKHEGQFLLLFDFTETEVYTPIEKNEDGTKKKQNPYYPQDWKDSFGLPVIEHAKTLDFIVKGYQMLEYEQIRKAKKKKVQKEDIATGQTTLFDIISGDNNANK